MFPEFVETVKYHDLFFTVETKLDKYDVISIDEYSFYSKPRKQKYYRKSGGLGVFIHESLSKHVEVIETDSDYVLWIKLCKSFHALHEDIVFGVVYIPPIQSRFFNNDEYSCFEHEIIDMSSKYNLMYLTGDWNSQTSGLLDYSESDDFISDLFDLDVETASLFDQKSNMQSEGIPLSRQNIDRKINNHGYKMIETCKNNNIVILNGRFGYQSSKHTFRDLSVIDYTVCSIDGYKYVDYFKVIPTDSIMSDGHALLEFTLKLNHAINDQTTYVNTNSQFKWNPSKADDYRTHLDLDFIDSLYNDINNSCQSNTSTHVDEFASKLESVFIESANKTFPKQSKCKTKRKNNKQWFGNECRKSRIIKPVKSSANILVMKIKLS